MTKIIKNLLGLALMISVLILAYAGLKYANFYSKMIQPSSFRSFLVTSNAKVNSLPDIAQFNFQVITEGNKNLVALQSKNTEITNKVITFLKDQGILSNNIKTQSYNLRPRYQNSNCQISNTPSRYLDSKINFIKQTCPPPSIVGYTVTQTIAVKIHNFNKIGNIMSGLSKNGANKISSLSFSINDLSKVQTEARNQAIAKAKIKAESIAQASGFKLGRLITIREGSPYPIYNSSLLTARSAGATPSNPSPIIQPGSQEINVSVTLQYEIK